MRQYVGHEGGVDATAFTSDGKHLLTGSGDRTARIWDATTAQQLRRWAHPEGIGAVAFLPDGKRFLTGDNAGIVRLWEVDNDQSLQEWATAQGPSQGLAVSRDGRKFVTVGRDDPNIAIWPLPQ